MQAPHGALLRPGEIVLDEIGRDARRVVAPAVPRFQEEAAGVAVHVRLDDQQTFQRAGNDVHAPGIGFMQRLVSAAAQGGRT